MWAVPCEEAGVSGRPSYVSEGAGLVPRKPRLLDTVRDALRLRHYSRRTERAYLGWIGRYIVFHAKRHPAEMGAAEVSRFLSSLAVEGRVSASTHGAGLRLLECARLRFKDLDFGPNQIVVRSGKGDRDRASVDTQNRPMIDI